MADQGERITGGYILITGLTASGTRSGRSRSPLFTTRTSATTRPWCSYTAGMSSGCLVRSKRCWGGSPRGAADVVRQ
jgi:hypothetical protein